MISYRLQTAQQITLYYLQKNCIYNFSLVKEFRLILYMMTYSEEGKWSQSKIIMHCIPCMKNIPALAVHHKNSLFFWRKI